MKTRSYVLLLGDEFVDWHDIKTMSTAVSHWQGSGGVVASASGG